MHTKHIQWQLSIYPIKTSGIIWLMEIRKHCEILGFLGISPTTMGIAGDISSSKLYVWHIDGYFVYQWYYNNYNNGYDLYTVFNKN